MAIHNTTDIVKKVLEQTTWKVKLMIKYSNSIKRKLRIIRDAKCKSRNAKVKKTVVINKALVYIANIIILIFE